MEYNVSSPWAEVEKLPPIGLKPRLNDLNGKTIGLFAFFKEHAVPILREVAQQINEKFPTAKFTLFQYPKDLSILSQDPEYRPNFEKWIEGVDAVISAYGDAGSCSMFLAKNTAFAEVLGKPSVQILTPIYESTSHAGAATQTVPGLRLVSVLIPINMSSTTSIEGLQETVRPYLAPIVGDVIDALTKPLTPEEMSPKKVEKTESSGIVFSGNMQEVNNFFYKSGWTYGMPIIPPTEDEVEEMLTGTDLPRDYVVAKIPPMLGKATIEKIAINAVMAGCLPTYMPLIIAGVQAMVDPNLKLEGYSCSAASWFPLWIVNGPIREDLNIHNGAAVMSPYHKPNAAIAHALGLITMNIAGVRYGIEDNSRLGHEGRFGVCIAENEEESPWEPLHVYYGLNKEDNAITNIWPNIRQMTMFGGDDPLTMLRSMCDNIDTSVFDPGSALIMGPALANMFAKAGFTRTNVLDYLVEYARRPQPEANPRWNIDNHHITPSFPILSLDPTRSCRKFWSKDHLLLVVASTGKVASYGGGGDHGGPITKKVELPKNWNNLVAKYKDIVPNYVRY